MVKSRMKKSAKDSPIMRRVACESWSAFGGAGVPMGCDLFGFIAEPETINKPTWICLSSSDRGVLPRSAETTILDCFGGRQACVESVEAE